MRLDALITRRYNISGPEGLSPDTRVSRRQPEQCPGQPPKHSLEQPPCRARAGAMASLPEGRRTVSAAEPHARPHGHAPEDAPRSCSRPGRRRAPRMPSQEWIGLHRPNHTGDPTHERLHPARPHARHAIAQGRLPGPGRDGLSDGTPSGTGRTCGLRVQPHHGQGGTLANRDRRQGPRRSPPPGPHPTRGGAGRRHRVLVRGQRRRPAQRGAGQRRRLCRHEARRALRGPHHGLGRSQSRAGCGGPYARPALC